MLALATCLATISPQSFYVGPMMIKTVQYVHIELHPHLDMVQGQQAVGIYIQWEGILVFVFS